MRGSAVTWLDDKEPEAIRFLEALIERAKVNARFIELWTERFPE